MSKSRIQRNSYLNRPLSSANSGFSISMIKKKKDKIQPLTDKRNIKSVIEKNLYGGLNFKSTKAKYTRNNFNKFNSFDFKGKDRYSNYTVFFKRKKSQKYKKAISKTIHKQLTKQISASQINPKKIFRDGIFNLTNLYLKKKKKTKDKKILNNFFFIKTNKINLAKKILHENIKPNIESKILDNHKYKNINLLKKIQLDKSFKNLSSNLEEEKNNYLMNKKLEYISYKEKR